MNKGVCSRFSGFTKVQSIFLLVALFLLMCACLWPKFVSEPKANVISPAPLTARQTIMNDDLRLYLRINDRMKNGVSYYQAAFAEHRINEYPTRPFVTVRLPTLALLNSYLGRGIMAVLLGGLAITIVLTWWKQLDGAFRDPGRRITGVMLIASGLMLAVFPKYIVLHELWAGMLVALSLGIYRPDRFWPAIAAAAGALATREMALPFVLLMTAFALFERRWHEVAAWTALICVFSIGLYAHAMSVNALVIPADLASPGWAQMGGIKTAIRSLMMTSALRVLPDIFAAIFIPASFFGWLSWRSAIGLRGTLYLAGYGFMLMFIGRTENFYWGVMVAPLLLLGLAFLPQTVGDLTSNLKRRSHPAANLHKSAVML
jgi:hypothetical protein